MGVVIAKVAFNLFVQSTLLTLPVAYFIKALVYKHSPREAMKRYWNDIRNKNLLMKYCALWAPVQCVTFSIIPEHLRITFIACISFFWLIKLSQMASRSSTEVKIHLRTADRN